MFRASWSMLSLSLVLQLLVGSHAAEVSSDDPCYLPQFCTPAQAIACARRDNFGSDYYKGVIEDIVTLTEPYVFLDILKNPPQPEGFSGYFKPVDLISDLKKVNTSATNFYDFYRSVKRVLTSAQDGHFVYSFSGNKEYEFKLINFYAFLPMALYSADAGGIPKMFTLPLSDPVYDIIENGTEIKNTILNNSGVGLRSINGMSPFEFIINFGSEYYNFLKNVNARYTYASKIFDRGLSLYDFPLDAEDFMNITFVYENGASFKTDFLIQNINPSTNTSSTNTREDKMTFSEYVRSYVNSDKNHVGDIDLVKLMKEWERGDQIGTKRYPTEEEILIKLETMDVNKAISKSRERSSAKNGWDYETTDGIFKCLKDNINEVNAYYINSFSSADIEDFIGVLANCAKLFDENPYPVIVINEQNGGGSVILSSLFQEVLQPDMVSRTYVSFKNNTNLRKVMEKMEITASVEDPETCENFGSVEEMYKDIEVDNFGKGVSHSRTKPFTLVQVSTTKAMTDIRKMLNHTKNPTDIVAYTDSFSFSAGAMFTKGLKEAGAAIIVGYNGYPGSNKATFDIGQSPTSCFRSFLDSLNEDAYNRLSKKGITYTSISAGESYRVRDIQTRGNSTAALVPREFLFDAPDERIALYDYYSYNNLVYFAKVVIKKYKTQCNTENPCLHLRDPACDSIINKTHMHGGYTCGTNGMWSTKCEGYYCDEGFIYDAKTDSCIQDACVEMVKIEKTVTVLLLVICILGSLAVLIIAGVIIVSIVFCTLSKRKKRTASGTEYQEI